MLRRAFAVGALLCATATPLFAAPECPTPEYSPRPGEQITDWHVSYISPFMIAAGASASQPPAKEQVEVLVDKLDTFNNRSVRDPLFFETLARQINSQYANSGDFRGLNTGMAAKLYKSVGGNSMDFSAMCIDTRALRFPDDTFGITLFGVTEDTCRHASLRGLVFTGTLINGSESGQCRADSRFFKKVIIPVLAGTNTVTFVCNKDANGCARR